MSFKTQVINGADQKYKDMLAGNTEPAIHTGLKVASSDTYRNKRQGFVHRIEKERKAYNDMLKTAKDLYKQNAADIAQHNEDLAKDKRSFGGVIATTIIYIVLMVGFIFAYSQFDMMAWINESLLPVTGVNIADAFSEGALLTICMVLGGIAGAIVFFSTFQEHGLFVTGLLTLLGYAVVAFGLRLIIFGFGYLMCLLLQPIGALVLAGIVLILNMIFGASLITTEYKSRKWIFSLACVAVGGVLFLILKGMV